MATEEEKARAKEVAQEILNKSKKKDDLASIKFARYGFLGIAIMQALVVFFFHFIFFVPLSLMFWDVMLVIFFIVMFVLSFWRPLIAFIIGLGTWLIIQLMLASVSIDHMMNGWIWKVMILTALIIGLISSLRVPKPVKEANAEELLDVE
ncbi:hypothetical protein K6119_14855 [Paracrocinitomix mangrovi]|uniref:hypothetical protein n=1 Tax=Paracrocinitomix mangrovi TaxID=2862509 RepID=UPI001C8E6D06|nr:hypothetical protein [Paracrocinitomix mangrovi]UKN01012.1 hypothetical protein K6119_14855 [Paracrocinitomix mangrovi]